jgi:hypothetical protein
MSDSYYWRIGVVSALFLACAILGGWRTRSPMLTAIYGSGATLGVAGIAVALIGLLDRAPYR